jgi:hypothetical protein
MRVVMVPAHNEPLLRSLSDSCQLDRTLKMMPNGLRNVDQYCRLFPQLSATVERLLAHIDRIFQLYAVSCVGTPVCFQSSWVSRTRIRLQRNWRIGFHTASAPKLEWLSLNRY